MRWAVGGGLLLTVLGAGGRLVHWATDDGPPLGDSRACAGTDVPLDRALATTGLALPADATGVHYLARHDASSGRLELAVAFRSTGIAMTGFLAGHGLTAAQVEGLDDGPYEHGDVMEYRGLCGATGKAPAVSVPVTTDAGETVQVAVEMDGRSIRANTAVVLSLSPLR
ncbi:hypothetical protein BX266_0401 [Streptomyces sp. TLI_171]|nr:hypothetical protein BX266_0401 [Streptomyces sp. TLI_171]